MNITMFYGVYSFSQASYEVIWWYLIIISKWLTIVSQQISYDCVLTGTIAVHDTQYFISWKYSRKIPKRQDTMAMLTKAAAFRKYHQYQHRFYLSLEMIEHGVESRIHILVNFLSGDFLCRPSKATNFCLIHHRTLKEPCEPSVTRDWVGAGGYIPFPQCEMDNNNVRSLKKWTMVLHSIQFIVAQN